MSKRKAKRSQLSVDSAAAPPPGDIPMAVPLSTDAATRGFGRRPWLIALALFLLTFAVFASAMRNDFVAIDDGEYVVENPIVLRGLSLDGVAWAFTTSSQSHYHPLTWLSHMLDVQLFGPMNAAGHHFTSVLFHSLSAATLFGCIYIATGSRLRSATVAALFALHPLRVESVVWISERKDALSVFFMLLSLLGWIVHQRTNSRRAYAMAIVALVLACLSKGQAVVLPIAMALLWIWPLRSQPAIAWRRRLRSIAPFVAIAILFAANQIRVSSSTSVFTPLEKMSVQDRIGRASVNTIGYVDDLIRPAGLIFYHPFEAITSTNAAAAALGVAGLTIAALFAARRRFPAGVGWLWYVACLLPVSGLLQHGPQASADRYTYFPQIGLAIALVFAVPDSLLASRVARRLFCAVAVIIGGVLSALTIQQIATWKNSETLALHALSIQPGNTMAHNLLGNVLFRRGEVDRSITEFRASLTDGPESADSLTRLALALAATADRAAAAGDKALEQKQLNEALLSAARSVDYRPDNAAGRNNYAILLARTGDTSEAINQWREAIRLRPEFVGTRNNLAFALLGQGQPALAVEQWSHALEYDPDNLIAHFGRGSTLFQIGRQAEATGDLRWVAANGAAAGRPDMAAQAARVLAGNVNP